MSKRHRIYIHNYHYRHIQFKQSSSKLLIQYCHLLIQYCHHHRIQCNQFLFPPHQHWVLFLKSWYIHLYMFQNKSFKRTHHQSLPNLHQCCCKIIQRRKKCRKPNNRKRYCSLLVSRDRFLTHKINYRKVINNHKRTNKWLMTHNVWRWFSKWLNGSVWTITSMKSTKRHCC